MPSLLTPSFPSPSVLLSKRFTCSHENCGKVYTNKARWMTLPIDVEYCLTCLSSCLPSHLPATSLPPCFPTCLATCLTSCLLACVPALLPSRLSVCMCAGLPSVLSRHAFLLYFHPSILLLFCIYLFIYFHLQSCSENGYDALADMYTFERSGTLCRHIRHPLFTTCIIFECLF